MTPSINLLENAKTALFNAYKNDTTKMLLWTGTIGWVLSAAGQIAGIAFNKKVSKKEKEFLIPQEIADAAVNITCFFVLTRQVQNFAKKLVKTGKIITPAIKEKCEELGIQYKKKIDGDKINISKAIEDRICDLKGALKVNESTNGKVNLGENQINAIENEKKLLENFNNKTYSPFEGGVGVVGSLIGSVISGNIITPMLRNPMASWKQKNALEQEQLERDAKLYRENRVILAQNNYGTDAYKTRITSPGGGMKI